MLLAMGSLAHGQGFYDSFDGDAPAGEPPGGNVELAGTNGWVTNDPVSGTSSDGAQKGGTDFVGNIVGYTPTPPGTDYWAGVGDAVAGAGGAEPGNSTVYVGHNPNVTGAASYTVQTELGITGPEQDTFGYTFLAATTVGSTITASVNLFSVDFVPGGSEIVDGHSVNILNVDYSVNGGALQATPDAIAYNSIYHLGLNVTNTPGAPTLGIVIADGNGNIFNDGTYALAADALTVNNVAATWILSNTTPDASGAYPGAGANAMYFNNFTVTVPEPSTWMMMGVGAVGLAVLMRRRAQA